MPTINEKSISHPHYPIVYVRGYAMTMGEKEETFYDAYYGFSTTSVEKREAAPEDEFMVADVFEGQMIRLMKMKDYGYADSANRGLKDFHGNPARSIWISRFYDNDYIKDKTREITEHAKELAHLILNVIPGKLKQCGIENVDRDYKVILIAHSMGGLVCRTLIQNILPKIHGKAPASVIHKLVTIGTPHRGIDLGNVPDFMETIAAGTFNPFNSKIFRPDEIKKYLGLNKQDDAHSLGNSGFPIENCLCIIGSDHQSYSKVKLITGGFSDGLVKQDNAYVVTGSKNAEGKYPEAQTSFYANVHRAHSGFRGIVNSYETYENIQRFLFGDVKVRISLSNPVLNVPLKPKVTYFYDLEFALSIRGTGVYLHRRQQDPCENAMRFDRNVLANTKEIHLHTGFLNSALQITDDHFSYFLIKLRMLEYRKEDGFLWDHKYPSREIYSESLEVRVNETNHADYRWLSDMQDWQSLEGENGKYQLPLRQASSLTGTLNIEASSWNKIKATPVSVS